MDDREPSFDAVRELCQRRNVDLALAPASPPFTLCLHGQFDAYGDFFSVLAQGVEYVDVAGEMSVSDILLVPDVGNSALFLSRWPHLAGIYSGPGLLIREDDADDWNSASDAEVHVVVANVFTFRSGADWDRATGR